MKKDVLRCFEWATSMQGTFSCDHYLLGGGGGGSWSMGSEVFFTIYHNHTNFAVCMK